MQHETVAWKSFLRLNEAQLLNEAWMGETWIGDDGFLQRAVPPIPMPLKFYIEEVLSSTGTLEDLSEEAAPLMQDHTEYVRKVVSSLQEGVLVLFYFDSEVIAINGQISLQRSLQVCAEELEMFTHYCQSRGFPKSKVSSLMKSVSAQLLAPVEELIRLHPWILIVPAGTRMARIPFQCLQLGGDLLLTSKVVTYANSLTEMSLLSPQSVLGEGHEIQSAVVLSSPIGATLPAGSKEPGKAGAPMPELPYAACEGRLISKLFSASGVCHKLEGGELFAEQVKGLRSHLQQSKVDLLHLACHFVVTEPIDQSSFRLSNGSHLSVQELADCIPDGLRLCFFFACAVPWGPNEPYKEGPYTPYTMDPYMAI